jgi:hypothetical protein
MAANHCEQLRMENSRSPPFVSERDRSPWFAVIRNGSQWFATVRSGSPMIKNLKIITYFYIKNKKNFACKTCVCSFFGIRSLFVSKISVFLIIGERWRTTANGCESSRTAIRRSFFEFTNGQISSLNLILNNF